MHEVDPDGVHFCNRSVASWAVAMPQSMNQQGSHSALLHLFSVNLVLIPVLDIHKAPTKHELLYCTAASCLSLPSLRWFSSNM